MTSPNCLYRSWFGCKDDKIDIMLMPQYTITKCSADIQTQSYIISNTRISTHKGR